MTDRRRIRGGLPAVAWLAAAFFWSGFSFAHEVRPAYLEITESAPQQFHVVWKQPRQGARRLKIDPVFPAACIKENERMTASAATLTLRWQTACDLLAGNVAIAGLDRTLTDVFVRIETLEEGDKSFVLRPGSNSMRLSEPAAATSAYLRLGIEHILFGIDHLLFVLGLFLLVPYRKLVLTITAFTVAHSITLGLSALGGWRLPSQAVEIVIALSICLVALEALHRLRGRTTLGARFPWAIAFGFGLIHGFGFAGVLAEIGLPEDAQLWALLLFNVGVEIGQLAFVAVLIALAYAARLVASAPVRPAQIVTCYALGISGGFWTLERIAAGYF